MALTLTLLIGVLFAAGWATLRVRDAPRLWLLGGLLTLIVAALLLPFLVGFAFMYGDLVLYVPEWSLVVTAAVLAGVALRRSLPSRRPWLPAAVISLPALLLAGTTVTDHLGQAVRQRAEAQQFRLDVQADQGRDDHATWLAPQGEVVRQVVRRGVPQRQGLPFPRLGPLQDLGVTTAQGRELQSLRALICAELPPGRPSGPESTVTLSARIGPDGGPFTVPVSALLAFQGPFTEVASGTRPVVGCAELLLSHTALRRWQWSETVRVVLTDLALQAAGQRWAFPGSLHGVGAAVSMPGR